MPAFQTKEDAAKWLELERYAISAAKLQGASDEEIDRRYEDATDVAFANNVASPIVGEYVERLSSVGLSDIAHEMDMRYKILCDENGVEPSYPNLRSELEKDVQMIRWLDVGLQSDDLHSSPLLS